MLKPVEEFQVDTLSQETSSNTSKVPTGDLRRQTQKYYTSMNSGTAFFKR